MSLKLPETDSLQSLNVKDLTKLLEKKSPQAHKLMTFFVTKMRGAFGLAQTSQPGATAREEPALPPEKNRKLALMMEELDQYFTRIEPSLYFAVRLSLSHSSGRTSSRLRCSPKGRTLLLGWKDTT